MSSCTETNIIDGNGKDMRIFARKEFELLFSDGERREAELYHVVRGIMTEEGQLGMDFYGFRQKYKTMLKSILSNVKVIKELGLAEGNEARSWQDIISADPRTWRPDLWVLPTGVQTDLDEELRKGEFECGNCVRKGLYARNTSHTEKQTRSADEPMTVFVQCHTCGKRYRFSS